MLVMSNAPHPYNFWSSSALELELEMSSHRDGGIVTSSTGTKPLDDPACGSIKRSPR